MKLSEIMKEVLASGQDLVVWVANWIDEVRKLEAELERAYSAHEKCCGDWANLHEEFRRLEATRKQIECEV